MDRYVCTYCQRVVPDDPLASQLKDIARKLDIRLPFMCIICRQTTLDLYKGNYPMNPAGMRRPLPAVVAELEVLACALRLRQLEYDLAPSLPNDSLVRLLGPC